MSNISPVRMAQMVGRVAKVLQDRDENRNIKPCAFIDEAAGVLGISAWEFYRGVAEKEASR